ncbi:ExbD/TolR family protein [Salinisphaera orenii]|uniref:ExbD/TolR family protein n=1 Tax=Salinisphaera orenii TaxID=856731 RepID=UPI000DBE55FF
MQIATTARRKHTISLTPLIDVVFILLVFFMLATSFTDWRPITLVTSTGKAQPHKDPPAVVRVGSSGNLHYKDQSYGDPQTLAKRLRAGRQNNTISAVIVQPDANADLEVTVNALDSLSGAGVAPLSLALGAGPSKQ